VVRRAEEVRNNIKGLIRLGIIMLLTVGLIIAEPDLGATVVISLMMLGIFFLAGAPLIQLGSWRLLREYSMVMNHQKAVFAVKH
jgi:cell division protein FtsW